MNDITDYLSTKNIEYKVSGNEILLTCPECGKEKLSINKESGLYKCWHCEALSPESIFAKGHFGKLQEYWGDIVPINHVSTPKANKPDPDYTDLVERYHYNIWNEKQALKYLYSRGFTDDTIMKFKLGFVRKDEQGWISIPSYEDGIPKLIKYRKAPPNEREDLPKYTREAGGKTVLFNGDILDNIEEVILCEGELDALTLIQNGYDNVVGITGGAKTFPSEWWDRLVLKEKIYLCYDQDAVGQKAARDTWATRLGREKCYNILLPEGEDVNSFFQNHIKEDFDKLVSKAERFKVEGVLSLKESLYKLGTSDESLVAKYSTPWESVNKLLGGGLQRSHLVVVGGQPKSGKTTMCLNLCHYFSETYEIPSLYFCLEMSERDLAYKLIQYHYGLIDKEISYKDAFYYAQDDFGNLPIYLGYSPKITPEIFYNTAKEVRNRYDIQFFVFDNLHMMVRSEKESDIGIATKMFKQIAMELDIFMILVAQPRKINSERNMTFDDLKSSSALASDPDSILLINRKRLTSSDQGSFDPIATVIADATRFSRGGRCKLFLEGDKSTWKELIT